MYKNHVLSYVQPSVLFRNWICGTFLTDFNRPTFFQCSGRQECGFARIAAALAMAHADSGHFPQALAELSPKYLQRVPRDAFTGKAVIYRRTKTGYLLTCDWHAADIHTDAYDISPLTIRYPSKPQKPLMPAR